MKGNIPELRELRRELRRRILSVNGVEFRRILGRGGFSPQHVFFGRRRVQLRIERRFFGWFLFGRSRWWRLQRGPRQVGSYSTNVEGVRS